MAAAKASGVIGVSVISELIRFRTLGEKRNACAALASPDVQGFLVADDDDIYLPHWFSTQTSTWTSLRPSTCFLATTLPFIQ